MIEHATNSPCARRVRRTHTARPARTLRTVDGRRFLIRRMRAEDRALYEAGVAALSERSRYLRFASPVPRLNKHLLDQLMDLDEHRHVAYAALTLDQQTMLGAARYVRIDGEERTAEVAIGVLDDWQRVGVGPLLLNRLIEHARRAGVGSLIAVTLSENRAAKALARDAGFAPRGAGLYTDHRLALGER